MSGYFDVYSSNTIAAGGSQYVFEPENPEARLRGRVFYRITNPGRYNYSLLFSNVTDSTFADGSVSRCNETPGPWMLYEAFVSNADTGERKPLLFGGRAEKRVEANEVFASDPVSLEFGAGQSLVYEAVFGGRRLPCHEESIIRAEVLEGGNWVKSPRIPFPCEVGCDRRVNKKIAFIGDSITQGIGTEYDSYTNLCARLADALPREHAYHNMGLGFARAADAATDGVWLSRAKHSDLAVMCFGVNDLQQGAPAGAVKRSLSAAVRLLKAAGCRVLIQTPPPFNYREAVRPEWEEVCAYIMANSFGADAVFDTRSVLSLSEAEPHRARYNPHPDAEGCAEWAKALYPVISRLIAGL